MAYRDALDDDPHEEEETYHESSDEDFDPVAVPADESSASSDEDEVAKPTARKGKRKVPVTDELDSGDEVTIGAASKRKSKKRKGGSADQELLSDIEDGEGGLIKTRAQRRVEQKERKPLVGIESATVDVDAIWAQMLAAPLKPVRQDDTPKAQETQGQDVAMDGESAPVMADDETDLVSVKKTYTFAGQRTTEEKQIPRSALDQHLSDGWKTLTPVTEESGDSKAGTPGPGLGNSKNKVRRPLRRPSRFDANPTGYVRSLPPEHQLTWPRKAKTTAIVGQENVPAQDALKVTRPEKAQKLNVVDKSRLDWTGFVAKEGIAEELDIHGKTKEAYLGRMEFLAGVEARREEERKRMKTTAAT
jgi:hypothetical protein